MKKIEAIIKPIKLDEIKDALLEKNGARALKSIIEKNSGKILSSVSKKLNYLIIGDKPTAKKVNQAKELGVKIINQKELSELLN